MDTNKLIDFYLIDFSLQ